MAATFDHHLAQGISLLEAGENKKAEAEFRRCTEIEPSNAEGYFQLGDCLAMDERMEEAIESYLRGLKLAPEDTEALTALGDIYFELGRHKEALDAYGKALDLTANRVEKAYLQRRVAEFA